MLFYYYILLLLYIYILIGPLNERALTILMDHKDRFFIVARIT